MKITDNHLSITSSNDILTICQPLFKNTPIKYFYYTRYYCDGSWFSLSTSPQWHKHFYSKDYYPNWNYIFSLPKKYYQLFNDYNNDAACEARDIFKLDCFFSVYDIHSNFVNISGVAAKPNHIQAVDFYFKNLDFIEKFILHFTEKASSIIERAGCLENKLFIPQLKNEKNPLPEDSLLIDSNTSVLSKKLYLIHNDVENYLTNRELDCLKYILQGLTAKEIARNLNLSPRTVETHVEKIKARFGLTNRSELMSFINKNSFWIKS